RTSINCRSAIGPTNGAITGEMATALFRIVQEALTNVVRHARATRVDIHLGMKSGCVTLEINDDGGGITEASTMGPGSLGILGMPDRYGLEVLRELHKARPQLPILIVTMFPEDQLALRLLEMGAAGYLTKESAPEELLRALERVMAGHKYLSPAMAQAVADGLGGPPPAPHEQLSDRELEVL